MTIPRVVAARCKECGVLTWKSGRAGLAQVRKNAVYCSRKCAKTRFARESSKRMAKTNRKYASARMKKNNPMKRAEVRAKVSASLRAMGWGPPVQGGNGRPAPTAQRLLAQALRWPMEVAVGMPHAKLNHTAKVYKLDIGNPRLKLGIEVDGVSHLSLAVRSRDQKKEKSLAGLGWTVLRFSNREVMGHLEECVQTVLSTISKLKIPTPI